MINSDQQTEENKSTTTIIKNCRHAEDAQTVAGDEAALKCNSYTNSKRILAVDKELRPRFSNMNLSDIHSKQRQIRHSLDRTGLVKIVPNRGIRIICNGETESMIANQLPD